MRSISVIVPCYNQAEYLPETLDSILAQTFLDWECIIIDDGSPDNTQEIATKYAGIDSRIKYVKQDNLGVSAARNNGIAHSSGTYILPLDADDIIEPTYISEAVQYLEDHPECKLVYCNARYFGARDDLFILPEYSFEKLLWQNCIFCSAVFRRVDFDQTSGYNDNMKDGYEDWDFWLSFLKSSDIVHKLDGVLFKYRIKETSRNTVAMFKKNDALYRQIYLNHQDLYIAYAENIIQLHNRYYALLDQYEKLRCSYAHRVGRFITRPFGSIRQFFKSFF